MNDSFGSAHNKALSLSTTVPLAVIFSLGLILTWVWLATLVPTLIFVSRARAAEGTYIGSNTRVGGVHAGTFLHPKFHFVTTDGKVVEFTTKSGATDQPYDDGQKMRVLYDPASPQDARLDSFFDIWAGPAFLTPFALLPLLIPAFIYTLARRRGSRSAKS